MAKRTWVKTSTTKRGLRRGHWRLSRGGKAKRLSGTRARQAANRASARDARSVKKAARQFEVRSDRKGSYVFDTRMGEKVRIGRGAYTSVRAQAEKSARALNAGAVMGRKANLRQRRRRRT